MKNIIRKYKPLIIFTPILKSVEVIFELIIPILIIKIINEGIKYNNKELIVSYIIIIFLLYLTGFITSIISQYLASITAHKIGYELRLTTFKKVINNDNYDYGLQTNVVTNDVNQIITGINTFIRLGLRAPILMIGSIIMSFMIDKTCSIIFIISALIIFIFIIIIIKICSQINNNILKKQDILFKKIINVFDGIKTIKTFNKEDFESKNLINDNKVIKKEDIKLQFLDSLSNPFSYLIMQTSSIIILLVVNKSVEGEIVALINYMNQILLSITLLINSLLVFVKSYSSMNRINNLLNENDKKYIENQIDMINEIEFIDVDGISFKLHKNQKLGIIGKTGSGKSTFINYLNFKNNKTGKILINNIDINKINYKKLVANVFQKPILFNENLNYNIFLNNKKNDPNILKKVNLELDLKLIIEENGKNISGGEKQRIAIARAINKNPALYLLDDASSSLDYKTEKKIYNLLDNEKDSIKIIVSSRINTIKDCDLILFMDEHIIGTHEENMKNLSYKELFESQKVKSE